MSDVNVHGAITSVNGSVTVANCGSGIQSVGTRTFASDGTVLGATPVVNMGAYSLPAFTTCAPQQAVGQDGTLYGDDPTVSNYYENLAAYKPDGTRLWSQAISTTDCSAHNGTIMPGTIRVGFDGNVYVVGKSWNDWCGNPSYLTSYTPDGTLRWQLKLTDQWVPFLSAYDQGVIVGATVINKLFYIDYNGNITATTQTNANNQPNFMGASANASGQVFVMFGEWLPQGQCNSNTQTTAVVKYGPSGELARYTPAPCHTDSDVVALSDGGAVLQESQTDLTVELVTVDQHGSVVKTLQLPEGIAGDRNIYRGASLYASDSHGNMLVSRAYTRNSGNIRGTSFALFDPHTWEPLASFDTQSFGDTVSANVAGSVVMASGKLYFVANQFPQGYAQTLYAIHMAKLGLDYPRSSALGVQANPLAAMAGLGDSFSSGLGSLKSGESYEDANCSRSPNAYARQLSQDQAVKMELSAGAFVACAGSTTSDITGNAGQASQLPANIKAAFLTIGGNDVNFARLGALCVFLDCT